MLAHQLEEYARLNCAVLALSEGGILVGAEIAKAIHGSLFLLSIEDVNLPYELEPLAAMTNAGTFTFNHSLSMADLEEVKIDSQSSSEQLRPDTFSKLNRAVGKDGTINKNLLKRRTVIIVSDGIVSGLSLDAAADFLKPILTKNIVVATPVCSAPVIDRIRNITDYFFYLDIIETRFPVSHYYQENVMPGHDAVVNTMQNISLAW